MMKMEIMIHELMQLFEKQVLMLSGFYLKKLIVKVSVKTRETHFILLLLLDPLLIQVLNIVVDLFGWYFYYKFCNTSNYILVVYYSLVV